MCDANSIMALDLAGCHQIRKRLDEQTFDGARPEHDDFVQTIEKLRGEPPTRCFYTCVGQFS
jgi:hypothetical protein